LAVSPNEQISGTLELACRGRFTLRSSLAGSPGRRGSRHQQFDIDYRDNAQALFGEEAPALIRACRKPF
jgi:hypothetical protein